MGLRDSYKITIPRKDSLIAMLLLGVVAIGLIVTVSTTIGEPGRFEGKTYDEIVSLIMEQGIDSSLAKTAADKVIQNGLNISKGEKYFIQATSLFTGERVFFVQEFGSFAGFGDVIYVFVALSGIAFLTLFGLDIYTIKKTKSIKPC